jgi:hypothetical protein
MMPKHDDLDFRHTAAWCDECWAQGQRGQQITEMRRANDLKERELDLRELGEWVEPKAAPRPRYTLPLPTAPNLTGGMSVEPRRRTKQ